MKKHPKGCFFRTQITTEKKGTRKIWDVITMENQGTEQ